MIEYAHHVTETIVNTFSTGFNVLLLYLIVFHSSFGTPTYQVMLTIDALLDLSLSVVVFLLQPVFQGVLHTRLHTFSLFRFALLELVIKSS